MELVPSFLDLLQPFAVLMTAPIFAKLTVLACGWIFAERRNVTGLIVAADALEHKHFSTCHRFFATAKWPLDELGFAVLRLVRPWLDQRDVPLGLDHTLARQHGRKLYGAGMHSDPLLSSRRTAITNYGHGWVVLSVLVRFPGLGQRVFSLPMLFALYLSKKSAAKCRLKYRTQPELAVDLLRRLRREFPGWSFHVLADSACGGESVLGHWPPVFDLTSRLVLDARLQAAPAPPQPGTRGRPPVSGAALPTPQQRLTGRCRQVATELYGRRQRIRLATVEARVCKVPERALRVVAIEALSGGRGCQGFFSTRHDATAEQILVWYALRWSVEVTFHDAKGHLGLE